MAQQLLTKANKVSDGSNLLSVLNLLKHLSTFRKMDM